MKHYIIAGVAGLAAGFFFANKLKTYSPWKQVYAKTSGAA